MRVLFITRKWPPAVGGMETYSVEMARELGELCDLTVLKLPGREGGAPPSAADLARFLGRCAGHLLCCGRRYDAVLLGDMVLFPLAAFARIGAPRARVVATAHGTDVAYGLRKGLAPAVYRLFLRMIGLSRRLVNATIANSQATAGHCRRIGLDPVHVVPLGVRYVRDVPSEPPENYVLFVGRIDRRKGAGWFAREVMPLLPEEIRFKVAGTVWSEDDAADIRACDRAEMLGPVYGEDLAELRRRALVVVVPNIPMDGRDFEGFGLTAVEASADGAVLLASRLDGIEDAVVGGETGFSLDAGHGTIWEQRIKEICHWDDDRRREFLRRSLRMTSSVYTWHRSAATTFSILARTSRG